MCFRTRGMLVCVCCAVCLTGCDSKKGSEVIVEPATSAEETVNIVIPTIADISIINETEAELTEAQTEAPHELTSVYVDDIQRNIQAFVYSLMSDEGSLRSYDLESIGERRQLSSNIVDSAGLSAFIRDCCWSAHEGSQVAVEITSTNFIEPYMFYTDTKSRLSIGLHLVGDAVQTQGFVFQLEYEDSDWRIVSVREGFLNQSTVLANEDGTSSRLVDRGLMAYVTSLDEGVHWADYIDSGFILVDNGTKIYLVYQGTDDFESVELCDSSAKLYCVGTDFLVNNQLVEVTDEGILGTYIQGVPLNAVCEYSGTRRKFEILRFTNGVLEELESHELALDRCVAKSGPGDEIELLSYAFDGECYSVNGEVDVVKEKLYKDTIDRVNSQFASGTIAWKDGGLSSEASN